MNKRDWCRTKCLLVSLVMGGWFGAYASPGITQVVGSILQDTASTVTSLQAELSDENQIYTDLAATLTTINTIDLNPADAYATMTTANSIFFDTEITRTTGDLIYLAAVTALNNTSSALVDAIASLTTANAIKTQTAQTVVLDQSTLNLLAPVPTVTSAIYADVHASLTTSQQIKFSSGATVGYSGQAYNTLVNANNMINDIKVDTTNIVSQLITVSTDVHATSTSADLIYDQTIVLPLPIGTCPFTISSPGAYKVIATLSPCQITIDSDDVTLMLNGQVVSNNAGDTIVINAGHKNIYIANGSIVGAGSGTGFSCVNIGANCENVIIEHVNMSSAGFGVKGSTVTKPILRTLKMLNCHVGVQLTQSDLIRIRDCIMQFQTYDSTSVGLDIPNVIGNTDTGMNIDSCTIKGYAAGIQLTYANLGQIIGCSVSDLAVTNPVLATTILGISLSNCTDMLIDRTRVGNYTMSSNTGVALEVQGINVTDSQNTLVTNSQVISLVVTTTGTNTARGIYSVDSDKTTIAKCNVVEVRDSGVAQGISLYSGGINRFCLVTDSVSSFVQGSGSNTGTFVNEVPADATNTFMRNISATFGGAGFRNVANVTLGYVGSNALYNYQLL